MTRSQLIVRLVNAAGEEISVLTVPMVDVKGPVVVEPPGPEVDAFLAEVRGEGVDPSLPGRTERTCAPLPEQERRV